MESPNTSPHATQAGRGKLISTGLALVLGKKHRAWIYSDNTPRSIYISSLSTQKRRCQVRQSCLKDFAQLAQMGA